MPSAEAFLEETEELSTHRPSADAFLRGDAPASDFTQAAQQNTFAGGTARTPEELAIKNATQIREMQKQFPNYAPTRAESGGLGQSIMEAAHQFLDVPARTVQDALDVLGALPGEDDTRTPQERMEQLGERTEISSAAKVIAGGQKAVVSGMAAMADPAMAPVLLAGPLGAPVWAQRLVSLGFSAQMLSATPELAQRFGTAYESGDKEQQAEALGDLLLTGTFAATAGAHGLTPTTPAKVSLSRTLAKELLQSEFTPEAEKPVTPEVRLAEENHLPATAEVLKAAETPAEITAETQRRREEPISGKEVPHEKVEIQEEVPVTDKAAQGKARVKFNRGSIPDAVRAAKELKSKDTLHVYATANGAVIERIKPPYGQAYIEIPPGGATHNVVTKGASFEAGRQAATLSPERAAFPTSADAEQRGAASGEIPREGRAEVDSSKPATAAETISQSQESGSTVGSIASGAPNLPQDAKSVLMRFWMDKATSFSDVSRFDNSGRGLAAGAGGFDSWIRSEAIFHYLGELRKGKTAAEAEAETKAWAREAVASHNVKRPKDVNWARWEGTADSSIENLSRQFSRAESGEIPKGIQEQIAETKTPEAPPESGRVVSTTAEAATSPREVESGATAEKSKPQPITEPKAVWQTPRSEWIKRATESTVGRLSADTASQQHRNAVTRAAREGKEVPADVLLDYPRVKVKKTETPAQATAKMQEQVSEVAAKPLPKSGVEKQLDKWRRQQTEKAKEIKSELVERLEAALEKAPESGGEKITIQIPGDGEFKMWNTKKEISAVLKSAKQLSTSSGSGEIKAPTIGHVRTHKERMDRLIEDATKVYGGERPAIAKLREQASDTELELDERQRNELTHTADRMEEALPENVAREGVRVVQEQITDLSESLEMAREALPKEYEKTLDLQSELEARRKAKKPEKKAFSAFLEAKQTWEQTGRDIKTKEERLSVLQERLRETQTKLEALEKEFPARLTKESTKVEGGEVSGGTPKTAGETPAIPSDINAGALGESGMGGAKPGEPMQAHLAQLTQVVESLPTNGKPVLGKAFDLGASVAGAKESVRGALDGLQAAGLWLKRRLEGKPVVTDWTRMLGDRHLALSESALNARKWMKQVIKSMPDQQLREAVSNWVDTGGDVELLKRGASETRARYTKGYERAQNLTPDERNVAENLRNYFEARLEDAQEAGILEDGIENYIHRIYEVESPWKSGVIAELRSGIFTGQPALAKQRVFEYDFEAEKAGKQPIKDFAKRVAAYDLALNKAIADRAAIKSMMEMKMPDGRPMIDVGGGGKVIEGAGGERDATFINRTQKVTDETNAAKNRGDYKPFDHPALRKWKWAAEDAEGKPIFVQGDVLVHPEAVGRVKVLFERSRVRAHPVGNLALGVSSTMKQTMLDLSAFHQVQIGVHAAEHLTFQPVKEIDFTNPDVRGLIRGGAVVGETSGRALFAEGLSGSSLTRHIPWLGEKVQAYQEYLFGDFIPRVKVAMGLHALERNAQRFPELSRDELYTMTASQMNAAFGELNYELLGRSKTMQDVLRLGLLAPDFLEARGRFVGQALTQYGGLMQVRDGKLVMGEQGRALLLGAVSMYVLARMANKFLDDEYHLELKNAFNVVYKGRSYGLRTVQGDLIHAMTDTGKFVNHRLNPTFARPALEFVTERDYFGRKRDTGERLKDFAQTPVPISVRGALSGQEQTLLDSMLNSMGAVVKRDSPSNDIAELAEKWKKANKVTTGPGEFIYDADKDPYRRIKLTAERGDVAGVRSEIARGITGGLKREQITKHFALSEQHLFAGSKANEAKFVASLSADEKKLYQDARAERKRIREVVTRALR